MSYTATTTNEKDAVTAVATETGDTVEIKVGDTTVTSGSDATWEDGENTVTITVTDANISTEKTIYTVTVTKE